MHSNEELSIGDALKKMFQRLKLTDEVMQHRIESAWNELMADTIKRRVSKLVFRKGVLFVYVNSSPLRNELFQNRYQLRDRLNEKTGEKWIEKVILK